MTSHKLEVYDLGFDTSRKRLTIDISEIFPQKKEIFSYFCQNLIYEISDLYCKGFIFYFEKYLKYKKIELHVLLTILCGTCRKKLSLIA